jgi:hypothetical protein
MTLEKRFLLQADDITMRFRWIKMLSSALAMNFNGAKLSMRAHEKS